MSEANCKDMDTALFFSFVADEIAEAKAACAECLIRKECLDGAVERGEQYGIWGGMYFQMGKIIPNKKSPGRPSKKRKIEDSSMPVPDEYKHLIGV